MDGGAQKLFPVGSSRVSDFDVNLIVESEVDCEKSDWRCILHDEGGEQPQVQEVGADHKSLVSQSNRRNCMMKCAFLLSLCQ